jgi:Fe-S oxidoreductase
MKISLFITCLADVFYPGVRKDTVEILERLGCKVDFPENQTCCGQPAYNSGYHKEAKDVAKHMIRTFEPSDYVVSLSGSYDGITRCKGCAYRLDKWISGIVGTDYGSSAYRSFKVTFYAFHPKKFS